MKGMFNAFGLIGINHTWINHRECIETVSSGDFFLTIEWKLMFTIGRWGIYIMVFWR